MSLIKVFICNMTDLEQKGPKNQQKFEIFSYFQSGIFAEDMVYIVQKLITYRVLIFLYQY